jgi:hypothetical protein
MTVHVFGVEVLRRDIPGYFTDDYYSALKVYNRYRRFGLPFLGGWAEQPEWLIELLETFIAVEERAASFQRQKVEKSSKWPLRKS